MSTYTQFLYQIVFGTYDYTPFLNTENENILFSYISGILKNKSCHSYIVGGASNHIHIITHIHPTIAPAFLTYSTPSGVAGNLIYYHGRDRGYWN